MNKQAEKYLRKSALPTIFCPGCGHGTVLNTFLKAIDDLDIINQLGLVGGIGCSSWIPVFVNTDVIHTLHGRAIPVATGLKLSNPDLHVIVFCGDGDCLAIGGNHFLHACRRNLNITVVLLDNQIYGMTGGQVAPTTPYMGKTQTSPYGCREYSLDSCNVAISAGATYVARGASTHPIRLKKLLIEGIEHKGFSFIHVLSQCPTQAGRYMYGTGKPVEMIKLLQADTVTVQRAKGMKEEDLEGKIVLGKLYEDTSKHELTECIYTLKGEC